MHKLPLQTQNFLSRQLQLFSRHAHVPFSRQRTTAIILLESGAWVPGVRIESASYPLTIPALLNAYTTYMSLSRERIVAIALNSSFRPEELLLAESISTTPLQQATDKLLVDTDKMLPPPFDWPLSPVIEEDLPKTPADGIRMARSFLEKAYVPESNFPVSCILIADGNKLIHGVNVENADWTKILCAERNALGTGISYGYKDFGTMYLTCAKDAMCSPCGACRQLIAELTPKATLWMDRGSDPEQHSTPELLLPASFTGRALFNHS